MVIVLFAKNHKHSSRKYHALKVIIYSTVYCSFPSDIPTSLHITKKKKKIFAIYRHSHTEKLYSISHSFHQTPHVECSITTMRFDIHKRKSKWFIWFLYADLLERNSGWNQIHFSSLEVDDCVMMTVPMRTMMLLML